MYGSCTQFDQELSIAHTGAMNPAKPCTEKRLLATWNAEDYGLQAPAYHYESTRQYAMTSSALPLGELEYGVPPLLLLLRGICPLPYFFIP